jgi:uncharacterized protein (TIGR03435 family)
MIPTLLAILASCAAFAQSAFEAASIKPADPASLRGIDFQVLPGGRLHVTNLTPMVLIREAYGVKRYEVSGGPSWLDSDRFDVEARAEGDPSREQMMAMLRNLLEDRFRLKVHREHKEGSVYALVIAKGGAKLKKPEPGEQPPFVRFGRTGAPTENALTYVVWGHRASVPLIAEGLSGELQKPVLNRTGITGEFDFRLEYTADDAHPENGPSLFTAIQEQLGLRLESTRGPISTIAIDHAEKPSAN